MTAPVKFAEWVHFVGGPYDAQVKRVPPGMRVLRVIQPPAREAVKLVASDKRLPIENKHRVGEYDISFQQGWRMGIWRGPNN